MMKPVALKFKTVNNLYRFVEETNFRSFDINRKKRVILCFCREREVELAVNSFGAEIVQPTEIND